MKRTTHQALSQQMFHTLEIPFSVQSPVFRMCLSSVGINRESLGLASPRHLMRLLGASAVSVTIFFTWGHLWTILHWVVSSMNYSKIDQSQLWCLNKGRLGKWNFPSLSFVHPPVHPSICLSIHPFECPHSVRHYAGCWDTGRKRQAWLLTTECSHSVRWDR